ncbi:hypothetical protein NDU88_002693 [Pleurodeles waltl]|uniref:CCHC-type domain-containing protein n=1 Tax=Pleurodeles waltl TaxID=8319 RepID=A0AAV7M1D1_PLEWA|nr:hypothetical protein NDU88_002693 [Pleurodeles waltl]
MQEILPREKVDWDKLTECRQKEGEEVTDFFSKMEEVFKGYSGQNIQTVQGKRIFANQFVHNHLPDLSDSIKTYESTWTAKDPAELLTMACYYENKRNAEKGKKDKQMKELKTKALMQQAFPDRGRSMERTNFQRGGGRSRGAGRAASAPTQQRAGLGYNTCANCYQEGHWKNECPLLQGQVFGASVETTPMPPVTLTNALIMRDVVTQQLMDIDISDNAPSSVNTVDYVNERNDAHYSNSRPIYEHVR